MNAPGHGNPPKAGLFDDRVGDGRPGSDDEDLVEAQVDEPDPEIEAPAQVEHWRDIVRLDA